MTEFELKLEIPPERWPAVSGEMARGDAQALPLQARYLDTADGTLARHGIALRLRREGELWFQTAKAPGHGAVARLEHNAPVVSAGTAPVVDLARHAATPVGDALRRALGLERLEGSGGLQPLFDSDVTRTVRTLRQGESLVEVALDQGELRCDGRATPIREIEFELKQGHPADAVALARDWASRHGLWLSVVSKAQKGHRLAAGTEAGSAVQAGRPRLHPKARGAQMLAVIAQACIDQVLANASEIAAGHGGADHIHQARIGLRRLRTTLHELAPLAHAPVETGWEPALAAAFRVLGRHRDHSRLAREVEPQLEAAGAPAVDVGAGDQQVPDPAAAVCDPHFQDTLLGLVGWVQQGLCADDGVGAKQAHKLARRRLARLQRALGKDAKRFLALDESRQHRARKRLKRLRYLAEAVAPLFGKRRSKHFLAALKPAQDALGLYNDELLALKAYGRHAKAEPGAWFAVGWLSARKAPNAQACARALREVARLAPFWD